jgi:hypothetical protein
MLKKAISKAAGDGSTGGVAPGYVEDAFEVRTTLMGFFSILSIFCCSPLPTSDM